MKLLYLVMIMFCLQSIKASMERYTDRIRPVRKIRIQNILLKKSIRGIFMFCDVNLSGRERKEAKT